MTTFDLTPVTNAYGGESIARLPDGRAVFIPFTLPGERVRVELTEEKRGFARSRLVEVLEPSPERVQPRCPHFGECGGCHYQHMSYAAQLAAKSAILKDQLERIGGLTVPPIATVVPSPNQYNYRNHIQFHLTPEGALGYHRARSEAVLPIRECHLPEPPINELWPQLDFEPGSGIERIGLRLGSDDDLMITLESRQLETPELSIEDLSVSVAHLSPGGTIVLAGSPDLRMDVLGRPLRVSAGSFFQSNQVVAARMVEHVVELLDERGALGPEAIALDLYCGVGLFSAFLAGRVGRLVGVEESPAAVEDFAANLDEFEQVEIFEAQVELALPALDLHPSVVLVDPPREGLERRVVDELLRMAPPLLVYVSCDPATLARDGKRLKAGGYRLEQVSLFDQFPQTYHIESVSLWAREK